MSLLNIKNKLRENWAGMDSNHHGRLDVRDTMGCNKDGDGKLDRDEVEVVTRQLSAQMEYNNLLLEHLQVWCTNESC